MATSASDEGTRARILVVDDEVTIAELLATALRYEHFDVDVVCTGHDALRAVDRQPPDLMLLDVMLGDLDGFEVARRVQERNRRIPILFLTARHDTADKVRGLTLGGDDYVTKPFSVEEVVARIRSILRRVEDAPASSSTLSFAGLELNDDSHDVSYGGTRVELTATEFNLLRYLLANPRRVLSKAQILDHVWHYDFGGDANVVETYVSYLRRKLEPHGPPLIHTVRGVGYVLRSGDR